MRLHFLGLLVAPLIFAGCRWREPSPETKELIVFSLIQGHPYTDSIYALRIDGSGFTRVLSPSRGKSYLALSGKSLRSGGVIITVHESAPDTGRAEDHLYLHNLGGSEWQRVKTPDGDAGAAAISPDGLQIAFSFRPRSVGSNYRLWLYNLRTGQTRQLTPDHDEDSWDTQPSWRPDGREIVFLRVRRVRGGVLSSLMQISVMAGLPTSFPGLEESLTGACYAPDGRSLAIWSANGLEIVQLEEIKRTVIVPRTRIPGYRFYATGIRWGQVAHKIAFVLFNERSKQCELWTISPDGSNPKSIRNFRDGMISSPQFIME